MRKKECSEKEEKLQREIKEKKKGKYFILKTTEKQKKKERVWKLGKKRGEKLRGGK